jgi:hypothetical protein
MARGFESKAVEAQQQEASERQTLKPAMTPQDAQRAAERATLMLARTRALS